MMKDIELYPQQQISIPNIATVPSFKLLVRSIVTLGVCSGLAIPASAQVTASGDGTSVNLSGNTFKIEGGTQPTGTNNLFHSFGKFDLNSSQTANFEAGTNVQNILGRIDSRLPSTIDGKIQVNGGTSSNVVNLYLMNPAGIVFGANASLNINGAFTATTARAIRFGTGEWFNALGGNNYPAIDPTKPIDFAFTNTPGSIFNAADLTTKTGQNITLVGGTVISTGDIKTAGGKISIATVGGGQYVQISDVGNILRFNLPTETKNQINALNPNFAAPSLPALLTGKIDSTATGIKIEGDVVKLVGDKTAIDAAIAAGDTISKPNRPISSGDIITKNLDASNPGSGGNIYLDSSKAILAGGVTTSGLYLDGKVKPKGGEVFINAQAEIKTGRINSSGQDFGGNVTLSSKAADIIVDSIDTTGRTAESGRSSSNPKEFKGGDLIVKTELGVFRVIKFIRDYEIAPTLERLDLTTNNRFNVISIYTEPFGDINIRHLQGNRSFVTGAQVLPNDGDGPVSRGQLPPRAGFTFLPGDSGSLGLVVTSREGNGSLRTVLIDGVFKDVDTGIAVPGSSITAVPPPPEQPENNPDEQAAKQKSKQDCTPSSTSVAANSTTNPNRSAGNASAPSADPCQLVTGAAGGTLQILNDKN
jgi:filamentous hemagglutinin family protein